MRKKRVEYNMEDRESFAGRREEWSVWTDEPNDNHSWAFIHQARRDGYPIMAEVYGKLMRIAVFVGNV